MEFGGIGKSVIEELRHQAQQMLFLIEDIMEVEQFQEQKTIIILFELGQLGDTLLGFLLLGADLLKNIW